MPSPKTNSIIFGVLMLVTQVVLATMHGIFIRPIDQNSSAISGNLEGIAFFMPFLIAIATVLGFGLIFSYNKKLLFSGLGFSLFIFAFVIQYYPLINAFWTKTQIMGETVQGQTTPQFNNSIWYPWYLSRWTNPVPFENHIEQSFKCAIAIIGAFACVIGRVGTIEAYIFVLLGVVGFQLNRQICYRKFQTTVDTFGDPYGTMNVFTFGGFMGLAAAIILSCRQGKQDKATAKHPNYSASSFSSTYSLLGTALLAITLPFLILNWDDSNNLFKNYVPVLCIILSVSGATIAAVAMCLIFYGRLVVRYLVYGPVAGAIIGGASSYYTSNPVYAIVVGVAGGMLQAIFMRIKHWMVDTKGYRPITTVSFVLFGIQGIVGTAFAVGWKEIIEQNSNNLPYVPNGQNSAPLILYGLISAGIGAAFGIFIGFLILLVNGHHRHHHFADRTYWLMEDCLSDSAVVIEEEGSAQYYEGEEIKNRHAYL